MYETRHGFCDLPYDVRLSKDVLICLELRRLRKDHGVCYQIVNRLINSSKLILLLIPRNYVDFSVPMPIAEPEKIDANF